MQKVTFYTKLNCSLCDKAYHMLMELVYDVPLEIDVIDITQAHSEVEAKYAERIPVIATPDADTELEWPFSLDEVRAYLGH
jgi:hypothetical protein